MTFLFRRPTSRARSPLAQGMLAAAVLTVPIGLGLFAWRALWVNTASETAVAQASVVIGTFVTLYNLFLGGFAGLAGFVATSRAAPAAKVFGLTLILEVVGVDLLRIWDSTMDLFADATTGLTYFKLNDDVHDFFLYFLVNVVAATTGIVVACSRPRRRPSGSQTA